MFFKPNAKKLLEQFNAAPTGLEEMRRIRAELHSIGEKNPAALVELLDEHNSDVIGRAIRKSGKKGLDLLFEIIRQTEHPLRATAIKALWEFGYDAASHLDEIVELFEDADSEVRGTAIHFVARLGELALPIGHQLVRIAVEDRPEQERKSAFYGLEQMRYDSAIVQETCREVLFSDAPQAVKHAAVDCLRKCGVDPGPFIEVVLQTLESSDGKEFNTSELDIVSSYDFADGKMRLRAVRALQSLITKRTFYLSKPLSVLWKIDPGNDVVLHAIEEMLNNADSDLETACDAISELREHGARFVPLLNQKLEEHHGYWDFCWAAVDALNRIGPAAIAAKPMLERMLHHPSELVQARARLAIASVEGRPIPADEE